MILALSEFLVQYLSSLNVLRYVSTRTMAAFFTSLTIAFLFFPAFIRFMEKRKVKQPERECVSERRCETPCPACKLIDKGSVPTMGGVLIMGAVLFSCLLWCRLTNPLVLITLIAGTVFAAVGFVDDWMKVRGNNTRGLSGKIRLAIEFAAVLGLFGWFLFNRGAGTGYDLKLYIPFMSAEKYWFDLSIFVYLALGSVLVVGTANATNLTDGMDGLAAGPILSAAGVLLIMSYLTGAQLGSFDVSKYLLIPKVVGATELSVVCASVVGATIAFLFYNSHPAQIFMGDTGALGLGAVLGSVALFTKNELISIVIFGIFFVEALSVILQTSSFKLTGRRIFPIAPIHHSFRRMGVPEEKIVVRFWIVSLLLAMLALGSIKVR